MNNINTQLGMFGARLKEERNRLGKSQAEFGEIGGVKVQAQGNYEKGIRSPDATYLEAIAKSGVDIQYIITCIHTINFDRIFEERTVYEMPVADRVKRAMTVALDVNQEMNLGLTPEEDQFKTLVGYTLEHHVTKDALKEFIKSAYAVAGKALPDDGGDK